MAREKMKKEKEEREKARKLALDMEVAAHRQRLAQIAAKEKAAKSKYLPKK